MKKKTRQRSMYIFAVIMVIIFIVSLLPSVMR